MLKGAVRREFEIIAVWSSDRLGRSLQHLIEVLHTIRDTNVGLFIHSQALDTTTPAGRALFQMLGVFSEFEREMTIARVHAGLARAKREGKRLGRPKLAVKCGMLPFRLCNRAPASAKPQNSAVPASGLLPRCASSCG